MRRLQLCLAVAVGAAAVVAPPLHAASAHLVADLDPAPLPFTAPPADFLTAGSRVVYVGDDVEWQPALWASDGTSAGTGLVATVCPPCGYAEGAGSTGELAFFAVSDYVGSPSTRVWRSDGTVAGTYAVTPNLQPLYTYPPMAPVVAERYLYVAAGGGDRGWGQFLRTDGGTAVALRDLGDFDNLYGARLVALGEDVYFLAARGNRYGLFRASAERDTVELVRELASRLAPSQLIAAGGRLFFFAAGSGRELWSSDGTAGGTSAVTNFAPREPMPADGLLVDVAGRAWFAANDGAHGEQLWVSDGTAGGTRRASGVTGRAPSAGSRFAAAHLAAVGGRVLFGVADGSLSERLWTTSGDWRSAAQLAGCAGGCPQPSPSALATLGNRLVFGALAQDSGVDPWVTDGTGSGTHRLRDLDQLHLRAFTAANGLVFFEERHDPGQRGFLWASDGTDAGTVRLGPGRLGESIYENLPDSAPYPLGSAGGRTFFASIPESGEPAELWATSGQSTTAARVADPPARGQGSFPRILGAVGERMLVPACRAGTSRIWSLGDDGASEIVGARDLGYCGAEVTSPVATDTGAFLLTYANVIGNRVPEQWTTDGTAAGTTRVPLPGAAIPLNPVPFRGEALFEMSFPGESTSAFWNSDGTASGTRALVDLPAPADYIGPPTVAGDAVYFLVYEELGPRLWRSDGTPGGTLALTDASPGYFPDVPFAALAGRLYFLAATDGGYEPGLWSTDGTVEGTRVDLGADAGHFFAIDELQAAGGRLWFRAVSSEDPSSTRTLWVSDGTAAATRQLPAELPDGFFPRVEALAGIVYFQGGDAAHGLELWRSDGTVAGTRPVVDLFPGGEGSNPLYLRALAGRVYFAAAHPAFGIELWSSDGTAAGTRLEADTSPGASWGDPQELSVAGSRLYFTANDGAHGREPWVLDPAAPPP